MPTTTDEGRPPYKTLSEAVEEHSSRRSRGRSQTILKQYELVRSEVTTSLQLQQQILGFGTATIGLVAGASFIGTADAHRGDVHLVFLPLLAYLALTVWFAEVMRMMRAGAFLLTLEKKLDLLGDGSLTWEATVFAGRDRCSLWRPWDPDLLRRRSVTALFLTLSVASIMLGWDSATWIEHVFAFVAFGVAVIVLFLLYHLHMDQVDEILGVHDGVRFGRLRQRAAQWRRLIPVTPSSDAYELGGAATR
jgi:hypothetical protein